MHKLFELGLQPHKDPTGRPKIRKNNQSLFFLINELIQRKWPGNI